MKKILKSKKMRKATNTALPLQSESGDVIKLRKDYMDLGGLLTFRLDIKHFLLGTPAGGTGFISTFTAMGSKNTRSAFLHSNGEVEIGCQTFSPKTVKAIRTWATA